MNEVRGRRRRFGGAVNEVTGKSVGLTGVVNEVKGKKRRFDGGNLLKGAL